jgi:hypothetical protein
MELPPEITVVEHAVRPLSSDGRLEAGRSSSSIKGFTLDEVRGQEGCA